jgi:CRISPR type I-E-associated protein CasB/Cse2
MLLANENQRAKAEEFFHRLAEMGTGERAALKRSAGQKLSDAGGGALAAFYKALPYGVGTWQEGRFFAVACLSCLWRAEDAKAGGKPFEVCLKQVRLQGYESFDTRVRALLDTDWDDDDGYLAGILPDFPRLLNDLAYWNEDSRRTRRKWAGAYFGNERITDAQDSQIHKNTDEEEKSHAV